ncbi:MAG: OmpH family outer membrane protein [Pseudomonadota bacterium]|nr:OmpH family outer membrane protein [Pseudomonadota bacterium]
MHKLLGAILAGSLMMVGSSAFGAATQVGIVDYQKIAQAISFQKVLTQKLESSMSAQRKSLTDLTTKISAKEKEMTDKAATLTADQKKALQADLEKMRAELQKAQTEMQTKMTALRQNIGQEVKDKVEQAIGSIATKHNIEQVFTSMGLAYAANKVDLTDELITELAKTYGRAEANANDAANPRMMKGRQMSQ